MSIESEAKHTPGPWSVPAKYLSEIENKEGETIASCWHSVASDMGTITLVGILKCSLEESAANARLIAAAPDMLAECEAALQFVIERLREECAMWQATAEATQQFVEVCNER